MLGVLSGGFTTPHAPVVVIHSRKCLRTNPRGVVGQCGSYAGQTRAQNERTEHVVSTADFGTCFLKKNMHFLVTDLSSNPDLEGSEGWDKNSVQFNLFYGHPNT